MMHEPELHNDVNACTVTLGVVLRDIEVHGASLHTAPRFLVRGF
jgi:hypothetical protein